LSCRFLSEAAESRNHGGDGRSHQFRTLFLCAWHVVRSTAKPDEKSGKEPGKGQA